MQACAGAAPRRPRPRPLIMPILPARRPTRAWYRPVPPHLTPSPPLARTPQGTPLEGVTLEPSLAVVDTLWRHCLRVLTAKDTLHGSGSAGGGAEGGEARGTQDEEEGDEGGAAAAERRAARAAAVAAKLGAAGGVGVGVGGVCLYCCMPLPASAHSQSPQPCLPTPTRHPSLNKATWASWRTAASTPYLCASLLIQQPHRCTPLPTYPCPPRHTPAHIPLPTLPTPANLTPTPATQTAQPGNLGKLLGAGALAQHHLRLAARLVAQVRRSRVCQCQRSCVGRVLSVR